MLRLRYASCVAIIIMQNKHVKLGFGEEKALPWEIETAPRKEHRSHSLLIIISILSFVMFNQYCWVQNFFVISFRKSS